MGRVIALQGILAATGMAHEGPPGHTHGDEWPFGPLMVAVLVGGGILYGVIQKMRRSAAESQRQAVRVEG